MRILVVLFFLSLAPACSRAQAWPLPPGRAYLKLSHQRTAAADQYTAAGTIIPYAPTVSSNAYFDRSVYFYGEYGLTQNLSFVGLLPYKMIKIRDDRFKSTTGDLGSLMAGVRIGLKPLFQITQSAHALALNLMLTLPTGYTRNLAPSVGPGQVDAQASFSYGLSLYPFPAYAQAALGYRVRTGYYGLSRAIACPPEGMPGCIPDAKPDYGDEWLFSGEFGGTLGKWLLLQVLAYGVWANQPPEIDFDPLNPIPTRTRYIKVGGGFTFYPIARLGLGIQYFFTPYGRNTLRSNDWFLGLEFNY